MSFLNIGLLVAGVSAIAIPIIIHLLMRRRRRPVKWGAMRFLLEAYRRQRRRLMMERWLLLLARCLLLALIAFALGRPLLAGAGAGAGGRTLYLLIDDSIASGAATDDGTALERHKRAALEAIDSLERGIGTGDAGAGVRVALVTLAGPARGVVVPGSSDLAGVKRLIEQLTPADSRADLPGAISLVGQAIQGERTQNANATTQAFVVVLSDFLAGSVETARTLSALPRGTTLIASDPVGAPTTNVAIVGVEPLRSVLVTGDDAIGADGAGNAGGGTIGEQVRIRLRRSGPGVAQNARTRVSLRVTGAEPDSWQTPASERFVDWKGGEETRTIVLPVAGRVGRGVGGSGVDGATGAGGRVDSEALLEARLDADSISADDLWRRPIEVRSSLRVGVVAPRRFVEGVGIERLDAGDWARLALRPSELAGVEVTDLDPGAVDQARLSGLDAVVIVRPDRLSRDAWARIATFLDGGGLAIVTPPSDTPVHIWPDTMRETLGMTFALAREAEEMDLGIATGRRATNAAGDAGARGDAADGGGIATNDEGPAPDGGTGGAEPASPLLALLEGELSDLMRSVRVTRALVPREIGDADPILMLSDGRPLAIGARRTSANAAGNAGEGEDERQARVAPRGMLIYLGTALDLQWTNLPARALMVPLMQELVRQGVGRARGRWFATAGSRPEAPGGASELVPTTGSLADAIVPVAPSGLAQAPIRTGGVWRAINARGGLTGHVVVNADVRGSVTEPVERAELDRWLAGATPAGDGASSEVLWRDAASDEAWGVLSASREGTPVALILLIGALAIALVETLLARRSSHAEARPVHRTAQIAGRVAGVSPRDRAGMGGAA